VVTAWRDGQLIGLARALSDDVSIVYIQDILVRPEAQRGGVGRALLANILERFAHVRSAVLLTDDDEAQLRFYASLGFKNTRDLVKTPLNAFVRMANVE
jgi:ribosomal protein S18 acetylase RimI-like enzyme